MTKHTPTPWKWQYWTNDGEIVYNVVPVMRPVDGQIENQADAQLIAAAPEMLEALENTLWFLDHHQDREDIRRQQEYIKIVTTKATGK